jgi:hypothetical protein
MQILEILQMFQIFIKILELYTCFKLTNDPEPYNCFRYTDVQTVINTEEIGNGRFLFNSRYKNGMPNQKKEEDILK